MEDIILTQQNELKIIGGDFAVANSEQQEVAALLIANSGWYKAHPLIGANLPRLINAKADSSSIKREVKVQLQLDNKDYELIKNKIKLKIK